MGLESVPADQHVVEEQQHLGLGATVWGIPKVPILTCMDHEIFDHYWSNGAILSLNTCSV